MSEWITYFDGVEGNLCLKVNRLSDREWVRRIFAAISRLGDGGFWGLLGLVYFSLHGTAALPGIARMGLTAVVGILLYRALKNRLVRERPYILYGDINCGTAPLDRYSFPSGHTLHAVSLTIMFGAFEPILLIVAVPFMLAVAASRVILGLHYPSDVLAGAVIGSALATTSLAVF